MPELTSCPECGAVCSTLALVCAECRKELNAAPQAIRPEMIEGLLDQELPDFLYGYVVECVGHDVDAVETQALKSLPAPLQAVYSLMLLDFEVPNGGFFQFLTNSSGRLVREALDGLRLIGAHRHAELLARVDVLNQEFESRYPPWRARFEDPHPDLPTESARTIWDDIESRLMPELERLSSQYYELDPFWPQFVAYVRQHAQECKHDRSASME